MQGSMVSQIMPLPRDQMMAANGRINQTQSEVFPNCNQPNAPQYMDQQAREKLFREQSSLTYSQEDSQDGTFLKLSSDPRPQSFIP